MKLLEERFNEENREQVRLSAVFDPYESMSAEFVENPIIIHNDFKRLLRFVKKWKKRNSAKKNNKTTTKEKFQATIEEMQEEEAEFASTALKIRTKVKAISEANAEPERFFSLKNRLKNLHTNRLDPKNMDHRPPHANLGPLHERQE